MLLDLATGSGLADLDPDLLFRFIDFFASGVRETRFASSGDGLLFRSALLSTDLFLVGWSYFSCSLLGGGEGDPLGRRSGGEGDRFDLLSGDCQSFLAFCGDGDEEGLCFLLFSGVGLLRLERFPTGGLLTGLSIFLARSGDSSSELLGLRCFLDDLGGERRDFGGGDTLLLGETLGCLVLELFPLLGDARFF